jgi:hypothetical protein
MYLLASIYIFRFYINTVLTECINVTYINIHTDYVNCTSRPNYALLINNRFLPTHVLENNTEHARVGGSFNVKLSLFLSHITFTAYEHLKLSYLDS